MKCIIGIDEVGRGPLAGPVAVCAFCIDQTHLKSPEIKKLFKLARDSKKLTSEKREEIFKQIKQIKKDHILRYIVRYESAKVIDTKGISFAIKNCIKNCLKKLSLAPKTTQIFLDGGLKAPPHFKYQKTIIKGDDKVKVISLASIVAKVSRDSLMKKLAKKFPNYGFEVHKGYGTEMHRKMIKKHGLSSIHRASFTKNFQH